MTRLNRAKLFAPYAALRGFETCIEARQVIYVPRCILDPEETAELNRRLVILWERCGTAALARSNPVRVRLEYFVPCEDIRHEAYHVQGQYRTLTGLVRQVDRAGQRLFVEDRAIPFSDLRRLDAAGGLFARPAPAEDG